MAIQYATAENYNELVKADFVIVDFYSATCMTCRIFSKVLEEIADEIPCLNIVKVNISDYPELKKKHGIQAMPTVFFYRDGNKLEERIGMMQTDEFKKVIAQYRY